MSTKQDNIKEEYNPVIYDIYKNARYSAKAYENDLGTLLATDLAIPLP
ncbi:hypothetical protein CLAFUW4_11530 [Fulvia fulva]|nr:uncharacterized protein CLAFUR5_20317 [Fulvia fulva]KAK4620036.1 hypothetical protein CLAFUR4_11536 [Fulvia fulva]KAK4620641.1 hypothetical protein CLAFUR0_11544 [Fulvia fulva]WMI38965.1 hypothetical protein CLAFUR5_20317 [Fulvia fulva]WPV17423.1 hypothetical protein CLAFUW4_11530 [Fulvia fulva]WPV32227.1 hypothetical protein CLAFUW7_11535 [Fulvia fulva]